VSVGAGDADLPDGAEDHVLGGHAEGQLALEAEAHGLGLSLRKRLRRQNVLDLGGPDPERERPERPVRGRVAVAADHGDARPRETELRADDVDYALPAASRGVEGDAEVRAVAAKGIELLTREGVEGTVLCRHVVIHRCQGAVRPAHTAAREPEPFECLRRGDLVDEMEVDVEQGRLLALLADEMALPDAVEKGLRH
jgi:hypothetical protein